MATDDDTPEPLDYMPPCWLIIIYEPDGPPRRVERAGAGEMTLPIYDEGQHV